MTSLYSFKKKEHLCSKKLISQLFDKGKSMSSGCLRIVYLFTDEEIDAPLQVLVSVSKKLFKRAVKRNLLKRRIREAYRLNKFQVIPLLAEKKKGILVAFIYLANDIQSFEKVERSMQQLLKQLSFVSQKDSL
jgi:ribonuclease P protein component